MSFQTPSLSEVLREVLQQNSRMLRVALPGVIESFDPVTQLAKVKPSSSETYPTPDGGTKELALASISNVPVVFPGGGGYCLTFPVSAGDGCLLVFCDRSLDAWVQNGAVTTDDPRRHSLTDAVAIVGLHHKATAISGVQATKVSLRKNDGAGLNVTATGLELGTAAAETAVESAVLGTTQASDLVTMLTQLAASLVSASAAPGASGLANGAQAITDFISRIPNHLSTKVRLK